MQTLYFTLAFSSGGGERQAIHGLILATIAFIQNRKKELASYRDRQEKIRKAQEAKEAALKAAQTNNVEGGNK